MEKATLIAVELKVLALIESLRAQAKAFDPLETNYYKQQMGQLQIAALLYLERTSIRYRGEHADTLEESVADAMAAGDDARVDELLINGSATEAPKGLL